MNLRHRQQVVWIGPDRPLDEAITLMEDFSIHHLPVVEDRRVVGMLSDRDLLLSVGWKLSVERQLNQSDIGQMAGPQSVSEIMSEPVWTMPVDTPFAKIAELMAQNTIGAVPLCEDEILEDLVTESDLLKCLSMAAYRNRATSCLLEGPVEAFMTRQVISAKPTASIMDIMTLFKDEHIRHVPIAVNAALLGMVSDRDVLRALGESLIRDSQAQMQGEYYMGPQQALNIMTTDVVTMHTGEPVKAAIESLLEHRVHSLPVVHEDALVGILTETDFVQAIADHDLLS